jgi:hypothetical protein
MRKQARNKRENNICGKRIKDNYLKYAKKFLKLTKVKITQIKKGGKT